MCFIFQVGVKELDWKKKINHLSSTPQSIMGAGAILKAVFTSYSRSFSHMRVSLFEKCKNIMKLLKPAS